MTEITKEYPERLRSMEMQLVRMLQDRRSWFDYMDISASLGNLQLAAKNMQEEQKNLFPGGNEENAAPN